MQKADEKHEKEEEEKETEEWSTHFKISTLLTLEACIGFWFLRGSQKLGHV